MLTATRNATPFVLMLFPVSALTSLRLTSMFLSQFAQFVQFVYKKGIPMEIGIREICLIAK